MNNKYHSLNQQLELNNQLQLSPDNEKLKFEILRKTKKKWLLILKYTYSQNKNLIENQFNQSDEQENQLVASLLLI